MLISFVAIFIAFWNHNMIENHLVTRLFKIERANGAQRSNEFQGEDSTQYRYLKMMPRMAQNIIEYIRDLIPECLCCSKCCKPNYFYKGFEIGREKLQKETNIIEILKKLRYFETALQTLLTKQ